MLDKEKNFYLKGNQEFNDRQKTIFQALDKLSAEQPENRFNNELLREAKVVITKKRKELKHLVGQESIFKRPEMTLKKSMKLKIPEFVKNPHKWRKYTLGDNEISEQSNRIVAMAFLNSLRKRSAVKSQEVEDVKGKLEDSKPIFNKYLQVGSSNLATINDEIEKPTLINGKTIMPEYVVGKKIKKGYEKKEKPVVFNANIKLDHLFDEST